ncbi:MAG: DUF3089 domain-containing protein [Desulfobacteraceae bacterium]|jgi:hypothetical protein
MKLKNILLAILALLTALTLAACSDRSSSDEPVVRATDYSQTEHWLSLPPTTKAVDVFYLYPTAWLKQNETDPNINEIDNASMRLGSNAAFARQATAFETVCNVYAPYYRQADAFYTLALPTLEEREEVVAGIPTLDVMAAFDFYIKHLNNGRPFILAGHSQGSNVLLNILSVYMEEHPEVYERMIAAYVIGYSVTEDYLADNPHLKFATGAEDTGVIISYNTQSENVAEGDNPVVVEGALAINPVNWSREETPAGTDEGLGSFMPVAGVFSPVPQYADATLDLEKGVVICTTANEELLHALNPVFVPGVYHSFDYLFYYFNLRANAADRIAAFLENEAN